MTRRIVVGMSGGVDSSVAVYLLKQQGHDVLGVFMRNWEEDSDDCPARQDFLDVLAVAEVIGLEVDAVNFSAEYKDRVFAYFLAELQAGRTPNPDVLCNAEIKFKAFLDFALAAGAEKMATGHYARLEERDGVTRMLKAFDQTKDQSYFLYRLTQQQISRALFPLGAMPKTEVRKIAHQIHLPNAAKKDSTGICFIGERPFRAFLEQHLPKETGKMQTPDGKTVGEHQGLMYYTLGQRQGLGIGGQKDGDGEPWFVAAKDLASNTLIVVQGHAHPLLLSTTLAAGQLNWISGIAPDSDKCYAAKTRYRQSDAPCRVVSLDDETLKLEFDTPQWAVTPGQSVVLYDGEICLGGGIIN